MTHSRKLLAVVDTLALLLGAGFGYDEVHDRALRLFPEFSLYDVFFGMARDGIRTSTLESSNGTCALNLFLVGIVAMVVLGVLALIKRRPAMAMRRVAAVFLFLHAFWLMNTMDVFTFVLLRDDLSLARYFFGEARNLVLLFGALVWLGVWAALRRGADARDARQEPAAG